MSYPRKFEYTVHQTEYIPTVSGDFDMAAWCNEIGQDGWEIRDISIQQAPSGLVTANKEAIMKIVVQAFAMRAVFEEDTNDND